MLHHKIKVYDLWRILLISALLPWVPLHAEGNPEDILRQIEQNNSTLKAAAQTQRAEILENKTGLNLKNPEVEFEHSWNMRNPGEKSKEINISQELDWSIISGQKRSVAREKNELSTISFHKIRQQVLLEAWKTIIEINYCQRMLQELHYQLETADSIATLYEFKYKNGDGNLIDVNRSKLNIVTVRTDIKNVESQKAGLEEMLCGMNGGKKIGINPDMTIFLPEPDNFESWYDRISNKISELKYVHKDIEIKKKELNAMRTELIPSLSISYKAEFTESERAQGFGLGMSIPLWEHKNKLKKSKEYVIAAESNAQDTRQRIISELKAQFVQMQKQKDIMIFQRKALNEINTAELMKEALLCGEVNLMDYLNEVSLYYQYKMRLLEAEKEYQIALARLYVYEL